jgi:hypothetical protein
MFRLLYKVGAYKAWKGSRGVHWGIQNRMTYEWTFPKDNTYLAAWQQCRQMNTDYINQMFGETDGNTKTTKA